MPEQVDMNSAEHYASLDKAWEDYKATGDLNARDFIAKSYTPLVDKIAKRAYRKSPWLFDLNDLRQAGFVGLIEAIDKFEPERGYLFSTFAPRRINGSILDEINSMDWTPRSVREKIRAVIAATEKYSTENQRQPSNEEIAEMTGLTIEQVTQAWESSKKTYIGHIDTHTVTDFERSDSNEINIVTAADEEDAADVSLIVERSDQKEIVLSAIAELCTEEEATVLKLNFYEGKSLKDIGLHLQKSPARISSLRKNAMAKLMQSPHIQSLSPKKDA